MNLGNQMQKGNCCGGYNSNNEDYVWELFRQAYPKHQVAAVTPYSTTQAESYNGIVNGGLAVLYGNFLCNSDVNLVLSMIDQDGRVLVYQYLVDPYSTRQPSAAMSVDVNLGESPSGWQFIGWQVELTGPVLESGTIFDFKYLVSGGVDAYPVQNEFNVNQALTPLQTVYSNTKDRIILPTGETSLTVQMTLPRLPIGGTGVYETYTAAEVAQVFRSAECQIDVISVNNSGVQNMDVVLRFTNFFNSTVNVDWLYKIALYSLGGAGNGLNNNQPIILDVDSEVLCAADIIASYAGGEALGCIDGLSMVRERIIRVSGQNDDAVDNLSSFSNFFDVAIVNAAVVPPGGYTVTSPLIVPGAMYGQFYRQPAFKILTGTPA